nr:MAG TPA: hypothetical protein [Caudoviricetes sp.]
MRTAAVLLFYLLYYNYIKVTSACKLLIKISLAHHPPSLRGHRFRASFLGPNISEHFRVDSRTTMHHLLYKALQGCYTDHISVFLIGNVSERSYSVFAFVCTYCVRFLGCQKCQNH